MLNFINMKLTDCRDRYQKFHDGTVSDSVELIFSDDDGLTVSKIIKLSATLDKTKESYIPEIRYLISNAAREAERDLAYMRHGNNWKNFVTCGDFWAIETRCEEEKNIIEKAGDKIIEQLFSQ